ncbi:MAG: MBL fold metallo-hydrolase [Gemmataceae bacterium]|nr:MBL fold metallo-hydrolase [Gemmataceae bacterium]
MAATAQAIAESKGKARYVCVTCGIQHAESDGPPKTCAVCEDERQYVGWGGQKWTTLDAMQGKFKNAIKEEAKGLWSIHTSPQIGIGQRAFLVRTDKGNILWDCVPHLDEATVEAVKKLGGIDAIAVSHPHYYTTMVEWSHAFGKAPVHLHEDDKEWALRPDPVLSFWKGETKDLLGGTKLVRTGGHFAGFQVLHWPTGKGVLLCGDQPQVCRDRRWVSFMWSYPNMIPLPAREIRRITKALAPLEYEMLHGAFPGLTVERDAKGAVERSAARYLKAIGA